MEKAKLPVEKAIEPDEEARQPLGENMTPKVTSLGPTRKIITFAEDTAHDMDAETLSQKSSTYKEVLSQPAAGLSQRARLQWLQKRRTGGLWAQCDECDRWRFLPNVIDSYELPHKWYCRMNPDPAYADCSVPETPIRVRDEEDLIHGEYSAGSVVWARIPGWPWWPAMVDDCPDTEQYYWLDGFSDIPTHYNVVFFDADEATRAWVAPQHLKPYTAYKKSFKPILEIKKYKTRLRAAVIQADDAANLPLVERLEKFSFLARYQGNINSPKVNQTELKKQQRLLKRKFRIQFEGSESEGDDEQPNNPKRGVKIILGSHKSPDASTGRASSVAKDRSKIDTIVALHAGSHKSPRKRGKRATSVVNNREAKGANDVMTTKVILGSHKSPNKRAQRAHSVVNEKDKTDASPLATYKNPLGTYKIPKKRTRRGYNVYHDRKQTDVAPTKVVETEKPVLAKSQKMDTESEKSTEPLTDTLKQPTSLAVQVGSTNDSLMMEETFDNDTSKTYIPEQESQETTPFSENITPATHRNFQVEIASPSSDDFEY